MQTITIRRAAPLLLALTLALAAAAALRAVPPVPPRTVAEVYDIPPKGPRG
ncbi:hypothetical protein ACFQY4_25260 [Catellatospora bangladeshensis]|uniref:Uncharacterized protein n=1 Tax=Catellatospora bangladeshensis TaxID=310355 RepID=A0A8J3JMQ5_9ACTN|nr:hypothetical protein [Catellatospora bangladeshensis]GIF81543.1 hypothetical protein Cba03nite_28920 [Catellatospora bangladeshensis]